MMVSPHKLFGMLLACIMACTHLINVQFSLSVTPLFSGMPCMVTQCSVPLDLRYFVNLVLKYLHHDLNKDV